ncbi:MAG: guanylate kinase [Deltaproteobacteria bacterium]|nr:guanylate kinase [Deltaproteobacteria bacterium]
MNMGGAIRREGMLLCLVGPSGGGKTTFALQLLEKDPHGLVKNVSVTTREKRPAEVEGREYIFVAREEFQRLRDSGQICEWEEVHGNFYGTLSSTVDEAVEAGKDLILDIDIRGAFKHKQRSSQHVVVVFLLPPDAEELVRRIRDRSSTTEDEIGRRLRTAAHEYELLLDDFSGAHWVDYVVVNRDRELAYRTLEAIICAERQRSVRLNREDLQALCRIEPKGK